MKTLTYNEAYSQLEKLVHQLEDDSTQLDTLAEKVTLANVLIALCENKLRVIEDDVAKAKAKLI
jgi:exodeoxyribonuclease VII small subunit